MAETVVGFVDDAGHPGRFDEIQRTVLVDAAHVRDERDVELATGDRTGRENGDRFVGETGEARPQHIAHAFGHRCPGRLITELAFVLQEADELGDEERVARGAVVQRVRERGIGVVPDDGGDVVPHLADRQAGKREALEVVGARERRERVRERRCARLGITERTDEQHG